jgi:dipeptidase E
VEQRYNLKGTKMKIVAIGGGEIGRRKVMPDGTIKQYPIETIEIEKKIIEMSGRRNPNLLFIGTASTDSPTYIEAVTEHFGGRLNVNVIGELKMADAVPIESEIRRVLDRTDIIYVGGGDTKFMLDRWAVCGFDKLLKEYADRGAVLSGISAGAICWFDWYDNEEYIDGNLSKLDFLPGLGLINGFAVPHYEDVAKEQKDIFARLVKSRGITGYGVDNKAAVIFDNGKISFMSAEPPAQVHII